MAGSDILSLFSTHPQLDAERKTGCMLTYAPQPAPMLGTVSNDGVSIARESEREQERINFEAERSEAPSSADIESRRSGRSGAKSFGQILAALVLRRKRVDLMGSLQRYIANSKLQVQARSSEGRDSCVRLDAALRKWAAECEQPLSPLKRVATPVVPFDGPLQADALPATMDESWQCTIEEAPEPVEQNPETKNVEEEMDEADYRETEREEVPKFSALEDYYEVLQISRKADVETIHRVYHMMALRFHPDNVNTGSLERFLHLKRAYQVLSDPARRAEYDAAHVTIDTQPLRVFESKDFVYGIEGEINRRLGVLSLLYHKRRVSEGSAGISVLELEKQMAFPREYLNFTLWYLRSKGYVSIEENSDYALTFEGVDFVEANSVTNRVIRQLLIGGSHREDTVSEECSNQGAAPFDRAEVNTFAKETSGQDDRAPQCSAECWTEAEPAVAVAGD